MRGMKAFGTQPAPQNFADGGAVSRIKGMLGFKPADPEKDARIAAARAEYRAERDRSKQAAQASAAPASQKAISGYASGNGLQQRMKAAGVDDYKDGGMVRGPGTGTSDEVPDEVPEGTYIMPADSTQAMGAQKLQGLGAKNIPVNLSNGEFKLPPEQVHAVGVQALDQMKDATHTPASAQARGMKPELFFASGGVVEDEQKRQAAQRPNFFPGNSPDAGANVYAGAGPANGLGSSGKLASGAENVIGAQPPKPPMTAAAAQPVAVQNTDAQRQDLVDQIPRDVGPRPAAQPVAAPAQPVAQAAAPSVQPPPAPAAGLSYADNNQAVGQQIKDSWSKGNYGEAVGQTIAGTVGMFTTPLIDGAARGGAAAWEGAKGFGRGMFGMTPEAAAPTAAAAAAPVAPAAAPVAPGAAPATGQRADARTPPAPGAAPPQDAQAPAAQAQVMPGVYQHGRGQYSDQAGGMGLSAGFTGQPSAQNMAAADALAGRSQQESMDRVSARGMGAVGGPGSGPVAPGSFTGGWSGVIGTDPAAGRERKALVDAFTTSLRGAQNGQLTASQRQGMAGMLEAERRDASGNRQADQTVAAQREAASMRETGENARTGMREAGANARAGQEQALASQKFGLEQKTSGFKLREAERMEVLRNNYGTAKTDDERSAIAKQIRELSGSAVQGDTWAHSPGGQIVDPKTQQLTTQPGVIYNRATGETRADSGTSKLPSITENPAVQQIMNDTALSREERAKQIRALGYK